MTLHDYLASFLMQKRIDGLAERSIADYDFLISMFIRYIGCDTKPGALLYTQVQNYILSLRNRGLKQATVATYIRNMKIFLRFVNKAEPLSFPVNDIKLPRVPKKVVHILEDKEILLVFDSIKSVTDWLTLRNKACVALMLDSGLRQSELCHLKLADVSFSTRNMKVTGKGSKERIVPLGGLSMQLVKAYLDACPFHASEFLFVNDNGQAMTSNSVRQFMKRLDKKLPFEFSSHRLRHNFATHYLLDMYERCGFMDCYQLMIIMGHSDIKTTEMYLHAAKEIIIARGYHSHLDKVVCGA